MEPINLTEIITKLYWPALVLFFIVMFRTPINKLIRERKIKIKLPDGTEIMISDEEAEKTLSQLFNEFYVIYNKLLKPYMKLYFRCILKANRELYVKELIEGYDENKKEHIGTLRALRGLGLIEPKGGGSWSPDSIIEVTSFGKVFVDYLKLKDKDI